MRMPASPSLPPRRPPWLLRLLTEPVSPAALEQRAERRLRPLLAPLVVLVPLALLSLVTWVAFDAWSGRTPRLAPRHRAEALCFLLARPPAFAPPMVVEPSAARVRDRLAPGVTASLALRQEMGFDEGMVIEESAGRVGDFDVTVLWLRLPPGEIARHWLVVGWMEGSDLEACTFRFAGTEHDLSSEEREWGRRLLDRVLLPLYFRAGTLPRVTRRAARDAPVPAFGPD
jgi:hypothetical protein